MPKALASLPDGGRSVEVDVPESLPRVDVDAALLERAVANLVANACTWSPTGHAGARCWGSAAERSGGAARGGSRARASPIEDRDRVFEPFQRLGDRPAGDGVGLGLAVARGFVEAMGGELRIEDTPGGGLTMVIGFEAAP